jgi:hypothetical protein
LTRLNGTSSGFVNGSRSKKELKMKKCECQHASSYSADSSNDGDAGGRLLHVIWQPTVNWIDDLGISGTW